MMDLIELQLQCSKQWSDMKPTSEGGFCETCSTNLVDFTRFSNHEIHQYLEVNQGKKTCGKFTKSQLSLNSPALFEPLAQFSLKAVILGLVFSSAMSFDVKAESSEVLGGTLHVLNNTLIINSQLKVVGSDGKTAVPLAKITLISVNGIPLETVYSMLDGKFNFTNVSIGEIYTIKIEADGYKSKTVVYTFDREHNLGPIRLTKK